MNRGDHGLGAGAVVALVCAEHERQQGQLTLNPLLNGLAASYLTRLPDILEPATSPNHRDFFHSWCFAGAVGWGLYELYQWKPEDNFDQFLRRVGMLAAGAYLVHLALDATTKKGLPLLGRA